MVTQADINAGTALVNVVGVDTDQTARKTDDASTAVAQNPSIKIDKVTIYGAQKGDGLTGVTPGSSIKWQYSVTNAGNVSLSNVNVRDDAGTAATGDDFNAVYKSGDNNGDSKLDLNETWLFEATGTAINNGTYTNIGTASDVSSYSVQNGSGLLAPTGTTVGQYIDGSAQSFSQYYAYQGGVIQYGVKNGYINQTNPGVFFYFTGDSGSIKGVDANNDGTPDKLTVYIDQGNNSNNKVAPYAVVQNNVNIYKIIDNGDGVIGAGDSTAKISNMSITVNPNGNVGDVKAEFTPDKIGSMYVVSVKYDTGSVKGTTVDPKPWPTVHSTFDTSVNGNKVEAGVNPSSSNPGQIGIDLAPKSAALTLDGEPAQAGKAAPLSNDSLQSAIDQAINYWAGHGASTHDLDILRETDVNIADLGGMELALTNAANMVTVDDDAAGYGWSTALDKVNPQQVDLLSTLVHEFGHVLGYEHNEMHPSLAVGERDLPDVSEHVAGSVDGGLVQAVGMYQSNDMLAA